MDRHPEDRFVLAYWAAAPGPCACPYWHVDPVNKNVVLRLRRGNSWVEVNVSWGHLALTQDWRVLIARTLRQMRAALRAQ